MDTTGAAAHLPVMKDRVVALLSPALEPAGAVLVDATLGRAGHARALLAQHPRLSLIGIDADATAIAESGRLLAAFGDRVTLVQARYDELPAILDRLGRPSVQGMLFDLGVSSPQLDDPQRGFAYSYDAPLDMRMDTEGPLTAADVVNTYPADRIAAILREYGEERFARRIADALVRERGQAPVTTTLRLAQIVRDSIPAAARRTGGNPAKRTFQALRIEVNAELEALRQVLPAALDVIAVGGRIAVLAYHSLEDRAVKQFMARHSSVDPALARLPMIPASAQPRMKLVGRKQRPSEAEVARNPRARSALLRVAEKLT